MPHTKRVRIDHGGGHRVDWADGQGSVIIVLWLDDTEDVPRAGIDYKSDDLRMDNDNLDRVRQVAGYLRDDAEALAEAIAIAEAWERDGTLPEEGE